MEIAKKCLRGCWIRLIFIYLLKSRFIHNQKGWAQWTHYLEKSRAIFFNLASMARAHRKSEALLILKNVAMPHYLYIYLSSDIEIHLSWTQQGKIVIFTVLSIILKGLIWIWMHFTDDNTRSFCVQGRSRSEYTECTVWSLIYNLHNFILDFNEIISSFCNGRVVLANENLLFIHLVVKRLTS